MESPVSNGESRAPAPKAPQPPNNRQLTGEITVTSRPLTSRWRPGEPVRQRASRKGRGKTSGNAGQQPGSGPSADQAVPAPRTARGLRRLLPGLGARAARGGAGGAPGASPALTAGSGAGQARGLRLVRPQVAAQSAARQARNLRSVRLGTAAQGVGRKAASTWRHYPVEATSVTLILIAGLAYPFPLWWICFLLWLAGAAVTAWSYQWDPWDKWGATVGQVAVVVVGTAIALAVGGTRPHMAGYVHEALIESLVLIKVTSLLSAGYLAWRARRGPRGPAVPPWKRSGRR